jgi:hypothetical protein
LICDGDIRKGLTIFQKEITDFEELTLPWVIAF